MMPKIQLDDRIMVLIIPVLFIVAAIAGANWVIKFLLGFSLFEAPMWLQIPVHLFFLGLVYKVVKIIFH